VDEDRPGLKARTVQQLARDLMLARDLDAAPLATDAQLDIGEIHGRRGRAIFLIGAGCSASAGIPLAPKVAQTCALILARRYSPPKQAPISLEDPNEALNTLISEGKVPARYRLSNGEGDWSALYTYLFAEHLKNPNHQREVITAIVGDQEFSLNWAHACLGAMVQRRYIHTVLTTNFDQLVLQSIISTGITPVVADGLESLIRISPSPTRPQVVHLHGSMHTYDLRNSPAALSETGDDRNLQATMMSLLKQSTVLVVVGYRGGEEGIMRLLQYAAENIPRMVVYWVAYEQSYLQLSPRARSLLEAGENKFFIPDQDADSFFQNLMRELGEGQPDWIANPIQALVRQGEGLKFEADREIAGLVEDYKKRVNYAAKNRLVEDGALIAALQARSEGNYDAAIKLLEPILQRGPRAKRLYAQSLQDAFDNDPEENNRIDAAIEQFEKLLARGRGPDRFQDAVLLVEARFKKHSRSNDELSAEGRTSLQRIGKIIEAARKRLPVDASSDRALLDFYEARAIQELTDKETDEPPKRAVIDAYERAVRNLAPATQRAIEAQDGLAQELVTLTDAQLKRNGTPSVTEIEQMSRDISKAIATHIRLVEFAWHNSPSSSFAGLLENLASDYEVQGRLLSASAAAADSLREAAKALERAAGAHRKDGDIERATAVDVRLEEIRQRLHG
jgi:SIR2-like protein